jgi:hypothetical protein
VRLSVTFGKELLALWVAADDFGCSMSDETKLTIIRRVRLRKDLKPISCLAGSAATEVDWLAIAHMTSGRGAESFDLVFLRSDGAAFPWMGFETLMIDAHKLRSAFRGLGGCWGILFNFDRLPSQMAEDVALGALQERPGSFPMVPRHGGRLVFDWPYRHIER